jgi:uncharacterized protein YjbJ (UPF0337 family)
MNMPSFGLLGKPNPGLLRCNDISAPISLREKYIQKGSLIMDKDRIEGSAKQAKGALKEAFGKVTGDAKTEASGKADKAEGKIQNAVGGAKDAARDALK